ncbi:MAG: ABC transporter permease [Candidatus Competibacterales bacterium]
MKVYLREAWRSLVSTKTRTALALIGIVIGIGAVIALVSVGNLVSAEATKQFRELGTDLLIARMGADDQSGFAALRNPGRFAQLQARTPCLRATTIFTRGSDSLQGLDSGSINPQIYGVTTSFMAMHKLTLTAGRAISDLDGEAAFVVVGAALPKALGWLGNPSGWIGRDITLDSGVYTVVGVLAPLPSVPRINIDYDEALLMPLRTTLNVFTRTSISDIMGRMQPDVTARDCAWAVEQYVQRRIPKMRIEVLTADDLIAQLRKQSELFRVLLAAIASISLIVGGVGIMNIMLVSVSERRQEIGVRRALGAKRKDIRYQFLSEALLLSAVGGVLGVGLGAGATYIVSEYHGWDFFISMDVVILGAGVSALIGVFFGFFPAHQAANMDPIQALRSE